MIAFRNELAKPCTNTRTPLPDPRMSPCIPGPNPAPAAGWMAVMRPLSSTPSWMPSTKAAPQVSAPRSDGAPAMAVP